MTELKIKGNKAKTLAALYNAAKPQGLGLLHFTPEDMTEDHANTLLEDTTYFDYVHGRVMKVDLSGDEFSPALYDRDNGLGSAAAALGFIE